MTEQVKERLEYLRGELRAERISTGELVELQGLADQIPADDVELREAAGLPEHPVKRPDSNAFDSFTEQYIKTALWSSTDDEDEPLDQGYGVDDIEDETLIKMVEDCRRFQEENKADVDSAADQYNVTDGTDGWSYAGHDFWLTRNGHGAGFWDGDIEKKLGERLTKASEAFGEFNLYVSDGKIYHS